MKRFTFDPHWPSFSFLNTSGVLLFGVFLSQDVGYTLASRPAFSSGVGLCRWPPHPRPHSIFWSCPDFSSGRAVFMADPPLPLLINPPLGESGPSGTARLSYGTRGRAAWEERGFLFSAGRSVKPQELLVTTLGRVEKSLGVEWTLPCVVFSIPASTP